MARSIWRGAISFGLVNVPVKLYSAVSKKTVRFNQLHDADGVRIQQKRVCPADGEEVPYENIVKGYEIAPDKYVVITPEELEALDPKKTRTIDIEDFVDLDDIDPLYYEHPYYLVPDTGAAKAYRLLLEALRDTNKVAIARVVLRSKEYLTAIRPAGDVLTMETMLFADELVAVRPARRAARRRHARDRPRARDGAPADRVAGDRVRPVQVPRRVPRARARPDRAQGAGRGHLGAAGRRGADRGPGPDGRARGRASPPRAAASPRRPNGASAKAKKPAAKKTAPKKPAAKKPAAKKPAARAKRAKAGSRS